MPPAHPIHARERCVLTIPPNSATAVSRTLNAVTFAAPSRRVMRSVMRLETTVPHEMMNVMIPANESGTLKSL